MTVKEIIDGLKFTVDMFLFDPTTGETYKEPRNYMDKTTIDACKGAIELLEQTRWVPVSEKMPEKEGFYLVTIEVMENPPKITTFTGISQYIAHDEFLGEVNDFNRENVIAWMPLPTSYRGDKDGNINNKE